MLSSRQNLDTEVHELTQCSGSDGVPVHVQIHFFPIIFNGKQLYDVMAERCGTSQNSGKR